MFLAEGRCDGENIRLRGPADLSNRAIRPKLANAIKDAGGEMCASRFYHALVVPLWHKVFVLG